METKEPSDSYAHHDFTCRQILRYSTDLEEDDDANLGEVLDGILDLDLIDFRATIHHFLSYYADGFVKTPPGYLFFGRIMDYLDSQSDEISAVLWEAVIDYFFTKLIYAGFEPGKDFSSLEGLLFLSDDAKQFLAENYNAVRFIDEMTVAGKYGVAESSNQDQ